MASVPAAPSLRCPAGASILARRCLRVARCHRVAIRLFSADRMVLQAMAANLRGIIEIAPVKNHRQLQALTYGVEIRTAELLPLGDDRQRIGTVKRGHRRIGEVKTFRIGTKYP